MKNESKTTIGFLALGVVMGVISFLLANNYLALLVAIALLVAGQQLFKRLLKIEQKFGWFLSNGGWLYVFIWLITWIVFYNL